MVKTRHVVYGHSTIIWDSVKNGMTKIPMKMDIWPSSNGISNLRYVTTILSIGGYIWYKYYDYTIQLTNIVAHMLPLYYPLSSPVIYPKIYPIINIPRNHHLHGGFKSHYIHYIQDSKNNGWYNLRYFTIHEPVWRMINYGRQLEKFNFTIKYQIIPVYTNIIH